MNMPLMPLYSGSTPERGAFFLCEILNGFVLSELRFAPVGHLPLICNRLALADFTGGLRSLLTPGGVR